MTDAQKLEIVRTLLDDGSGYSPTDETLNTYIEVAGNEILAWMYHLVGGVPSNVIAVPAKYESVQIYAEGQTLSIENGVHRDFKYTDMLDYIHNNVLPIVRVGAVSAS